MIQSSKMTKVELQASISLAAVLFLRMLGLFLILPVFVLYARDLPGATPILVGVAFGIYGLTQAGLQIPFGLLSDKIGRRPVIVFGLLIFAGGSAIAALSNSIGSMILGRCLQGAGVISAATLALVADLTRAAQRTKAMALIGIGIGLAFALAFIAGPLLSGLIGGRGIFMLSAGLALCAVILLLGCVPKPEETTFHHDTEVAINRLGQAFRNRRLVGLNLGIFVLHAVLMANFVMIPVALEDFADFALARHWQIYLPVFLGSFFIVVPAILLGERHDLDTVFYRCAIIVLILSQFAFYYWHRHLEALVITLFAFFTAFNYLEASLPALVSKTATPKNRGTALGIYASSQFLGTFMGGLGAGVIQVYGGSSAIFVFSGIMAFVWLVSLPYWGRLNKTS